MIVIVLLNVFLVIGLTMIAMWGKSTAFSKQKTMLLWFGYGLLVVVGVLVFIMLAKQHLRRGVIPTLEQRPNSYDLDIKRPEEL